MQNETVAAIATAQGGAGLGVVRISGPQARQVAACVFVPVKGKSLPEAKGYTALYGRVQDGAEEIDEALALVFLSPHSYTGEDVVELSCHGGTYLLQRVLRAVLQNGASPAGAGEFTKRAFLNGKLGLTEAEAVMDLVSAQGAQAARAALAAHDGALQKELLGVTAQLVSLSADLAAWIDFPEEEVPAVEAGRLRRTLEETVSRLDALLSTFETGRILREGLNTVIAGKPNVGKSTLMNLLAGKERSIVTDIPGTTRDVVEDTVTLGGVTLRLADTAGLRPTDDPVERIGVEFAQKRLAAADLILAVFDSSEPLTGDDFTLMRSLGDIPAIAVVNKTDLDNALDRKELRRYFSHVVELSATTGSGVDELAQTIGELFALGTFDPMRAVLANERQRDCAARARQLLQEAQIALDLTLDAVCVNIDCALDALMELTGEKASEAVIDSVFERFCVGK